MYKIKRNCRVSHQNFPKQKTQYRIVIPVVFAEIMQLDNATRFELELFDADTIVARRVAD